MAAVTLPSMGIKHRCFWGAWVVWSVKPPTSAQVMISQFVSSSPTSGSLLSAQSLLQILCPPLSLPLPCSHSLPPPKKKFKNVRYGSHVQRLYHYLPPKLVSWRQHIDWSCFFVLIFHLRHIPLSPHFVYLSVPVFMCLKSQLHLLLFKIVAL